MDMIDLERRLTEFFIEASEMTIDHDIFRGILPGDKCDAVGVIVNHDETGNTPSMGKYSAQILGRYRNRDEAMRIAGRLWTLLPYYGDGLIILRVGSTGCYPTKWSGGDAWGVSINLQLTVK